MGRPFWRPWVLVAWLALISAIASGMPSLAEAQGATPAATPTATVSNTEIQPYDLPAMMLQPEDIGSGYGIAAAQFNDLDTMAGQFSAALGISQAEARNQLVAADLQSVYNVTFALPAKDTSQGSTTARVVTAFLYLYGTANGGQTGYDLLGQAWGKPGYEAATGTKQYGNETQLARVNQSNGADQRLLLSFRVHEIVAGVGIQDTTGAAPTVKEIESLASALRQRMKDVQDGNGPNLAAHTLHIDSSGGFNLTTTEYYDRLDGTTIRHFADSDEVLARRQASHGTSIDVYVSAEIVQRQGVGDNLPYTIVTATTLHFADDSAAADFITSAAQPFLQAAGVSRASVADKARAFGDSSEAFSYEISYGQGVTATGFVYFVQVGSQVAVVQADAQGGVNRDAVEKLTQQQVDCLTDDSCRPAAVPSGLVAMK